MGVNRTQNSIKAAKNSAWRWGAGEERPNPRARKAKKCARSRIKHQGANICAMLKPAIDIMNKDVATNIKNRF